MPILASNKNCTGCLACVDSCYRNALAAIYDDEGHLFYHLFVDKCINCGLCEKSCPVVSSYEYGNNNLLLSTPFAAWSTDHELRSRSTSGGVFASIAKGVLVNGGLVVGAQMKDNIVTHILISDISELSKLQGSKYAQSLTNGIFLRVKSALIEGKTVLFTGLGCQVAGLLKFTSQFNYSGKLLTIDLICGGVPSRFIISKYLEHFANSVDYITAFRNKSLYQLSVKLKDGIEKIVPLKEKPLPLCGFYTELTNRYSCYDCQFAKAHRMSDLTIGDYWGDTEYLEQHKNGLSVVVVHTKEGQKLLDANDLEVHQIDWGNFLLHNPRMVYGKSDLGNTKARIYLFDNFANLNYERLLEIYANKASLKQPIKLIQKVYRFIKGKANHKMIIKKVTKIISEYK